MPCEICPADRVAAPCRECGSAATHLVDGGFYCAAHCAVCGVLASMDWDSMPQTFAGEQGDLWEK
jgi:hypothetical protein